jgi:hypothetical protein
LRSVTVQLDRTQAEQAAKPVRRGVKASRGRARQQLAGESSLTHAHERATLT